MPVPFSTHWNMPLSRFADYQAEVAALKAEYAGRIQIYCGLEMDFIPGVAGSFNPCFEDAHLDYTIGSIHFVEAYEDGKPLEIDGPHSIFLDGLKKIFKGDVKKIIRRYFALTRQMIETDCPNVVGHVDKIKMQNEGGKLFSESDNWYRAEMLQTLDAIEAAGIITEVNTRGIYKKVVSETYPSRWVLEHMHARRLPIMLNSDSHHPDEVDGNFRETAMMLRQIGFTHLHILWNGEWIPVSFSPEGITIPWMSP
jgi:histidinol-phosphatase (PHP family)